MLKNRDALFSIIVIVCITAVLCAVYVLFPSGGLYIILMEGIVYLFLFHCFLSRRNEKINRLSEFLRRAQNEILPLEISDQAEGELNILKSELYKIITKLHSQAELLKQDKKYLADTISDISHQLKTPMTSMNVMIDLLKDDSLSPDKRREFTRALHRQMARMEWLLSAMLTMSRLDAEAIVLKKETVHVPDLIHLAVEHLRIPMELHEQRLLTEEVRDVTFRGDMYWTSEAVSNILKNCIEHTPDKGTITVTAGENSIYTSILIQDEGGGIAEKDISHIFERFYKGINSSADSVGIGLALARQLISSQNGTLEVSSVFGESTTFLIKFYHRNV